MILRIRPAQVYKRKIRVVRPSSRADVILALLFSMVFVTVGVSSFTVFCWKVASDLGEFPHFPFVQGFLSKKGFWLFLAALAWLFAKLIDAFAKLLKSPKGAADEQPTETAGEFAAALK